MPKPSQTEVSSWLSWHRGTLVSLTDCRWFDSSLSRKVKGEILSPIVGTGARPTPRGSQSSTAPTSVWDPQIQTESNSQTNTRKPNTITRRWSLSLSCAATGGTAHLDADSCTSLINSATAPRKVHFVPWRAADGSLASSSFSRLSSLCLQQCATSKAQSTLRQCRARCMIFFFVRRLLSSRQVVTQCLCQLNELCSILHRSLFGVSKESMDLYTIQVVHVRWRPHKKKEQNNQKKTSKPTQTPTEKSPSLWT